MYNEEENFKIYGRHCNLTRKANLFKSIKHKVGTTTNGNNYIKLYLVGFDNLEAADNFGKIIRNLLSENCGYHTDWSKWSFFADNENKTIKFVPTSYWEEYHDIPNISRNFVEFPSICGFRYNDDQSISYDGEFDEAISILNHLEINRIYENDI